MKQLILIDGNSLLFRSYFAMRPMVTSSGIHTQGIFAFINILNKIINDYSPDYMAVAFDMKEKTFRHDRYSEYKAGRMATPIELLAEIPLTHKVLEAMNIAVLEMPKYEADDLIGTAARRASAEGIRTLVISGDKDELQLVDENVNVLINKKGMSDFDLYDVAAMKDRYGLTPTQFIDLKGLMGDKSDNIPGIPGVGEKKGLALLEKYGSVENVLAHADEIPGKLGENVRENIEQAELSKWLATINTDSPIEFTWDELKFTEPDYKALIDVYTELEFSSFIKKLNVSADDNSLDESMANSFAEELKEIRTVDFSEFLNTVGTGEELIISIETDNNHLDVPEVKEICLYSDERKLFCCKALTALDSEISIKQLADRNYRLTGADLKPVVYSFMSILESEWNPAFDIYIAEYLLDANRNKYQLDKMLLRYCSVSIASEELSKEEELFYISEIRKEQDKALADKGLAELFYNCEMPLVVTLAAMEKTGISLDAEVLTSIGNEIDGRISELETEIYEEAGRKFNINSPKQLGIVLFDELGIPYPKAKSASSYSTAADILDKLKADYDIVNKVLEYRKCSKLKSTYIDGLLALNGSDRRIRPHFQQTVAATGRLSCTEPNLQNIPIRDEYGREIRKAFVTASSDNVFTGSDYSQIELRILAALSGDEILIDAFCQGKDIHRATASSVFDVPFDQVTPAERSKAKAVNFGVVYGMSGFGLSENLSISRAEGQKYINDYFEKHTAVKEYLDRQVAEGEENQEIRTYFGRLRKIPEFTSRKYMEREAAKRLAMNTPIQGTAADIIKFAMNSVYRELKDRKLESRLILQIHDELIVEGPAAEGDEVRKILDECMKNAAQLSVELTCDIHSGKTLYELK
ncbi:MAG: DNA polymerase I [Clostridiales bacterium]|nr:DNA polymerase I [Candidatus Crickella caballi]